MCTLTSNAAPPYINIIMNLSQSTARHWLMPPHIMSIK